MEQIIYLNGNYVPGKKACISPQDRGFMLADGIYEVIRFYNGKAFELDRHMDRLKENLGKVKIEFSDINGLRKVVNKLIKKNDLEKRVAGTYIQITRGAHPRMHKFPPKIVQPTVYANAFRMDHYLENLKNGIKVIVKEDIRWHRCDIKSIALLPNTLLYQEATEQDAGECLLNRNGKITEASHSNYFAIKDGKLYTHPLNNYILPGITRKVVFDICKENDIDILEEAVKIDEIFTFDEMFLCGTGNEISPVVQVGDKRIGLGKPGKVTRLVQRLFLEKIYPDLKNIKILAFISK